jgi:hypothetical protein
MTRLGWDSLAQKFSPVEVLEQELTAAERLNEADALTE